MGKIDFVRDYNPPVFRKIAYGTWRTVGDPSVYAQIDLDMSHALDFAKNYSEKNNVKITPSHLAASAITRCMKLRPEINGMFRRGKVALRQKVAIFFQVNVPGPKSDVDRTAKASLSGTLVSGTEEMTLAELANRLSRNAGEIRDGRDRSFNKTMNIIRLLPWSWVRHFLNFCTWLTYGLNLDLSFLGIPKDPFGSVMITNVGSLGIDVAWAPLCPYTRVPLILCLGSVSDKVVAQKGQPVVRPVMSIGFTFDHRFMDGVHAAEMSREFKKCFAEPEKYFS